MNRGIETCCICDLSTGRADESEDSLYGKKGDGPYCEDCYRWKYGQTGKIFTPKQLADRLQKTGETVVLQNWQAQHAAIEKAAGELESLPEPTAIELIGRDW